MAKGMGIAALVLAIIGALMPVIGLIIGWIGLIAATMSAFLGGRGLPIATIVISAVAFLFLTPSLWAEAVNVSVNNPYAASSSPTLKYISIALLAAPIIGMVTSNSAE